MERTTSVHSATILAFPVGGRRGSRPWGAHPAQAGQPVEAVVDTDAWYHQAAMDEEKPRGNA